MNIRVQIILLLCCIQTSFGQQSFVEAVYYDTTDIPYKIELKYVENGIVRYVSHFNDGSICVIRKILHKGDTTILKESIYRVFNEETKLDKFQECSMWNMSTNATGDTMWIRGERYDFLVDSGGFVFIADTILTGEAARDGLRFDEKVKKARVPLILSKQIVVAMDSLILDETVVACFVNGFPVGVEIFDAKGNKYEMETSEWKKNKVTYKRYFTRDGGKPFQKDIASWNKDTTEVTWKSDRFEWKKPARARLTIKGNTLAESWNNREDRLRQFVDSTNILQNFLVTWLIYDDVMYSIELRYFDRQKIVSISGDERNANNTYLYDAQNRIIEQRSFENGRLQKRVTYAYE